MPHSSVLSMPDVHILYSKHVYSYRTCLFVCILVGNHHWLYSGHPRCHYGHHFPGSRNLSPRPHHIGPGCQRGQGDLDDDGGGDPDSDHDSCEYEDAAPAGEHGCVFLDWVEFV